MASTTQPGNIGGLTAVPDSQSAVDLRPPQPPQPPRPAAPDVAAWSQRLSTAPPPPPAVPQLTQEGKEQAMEAKQEGFFESLKRGFLGEVSSALTMVRNSTALLDLIARRYARASGTTHAQAVSEIRSWLARKASELEQPPPQADTTLGAVAATVGRAVGAAPVMAAEIAVASRLVRRNPLLAFALVEGLKAAHLGPPEAVKQALIGAATGAIMTKAGTLPSAWKRFGAAATGTAALHTVTGAEPHEALASGITAGLFSLPSVAEAKVGAAAEKKPSVATAAPNVKGMDPISPWRAYLLSPSIYMRLLDKVPKAADFVLKAELAERHFRRTADDLDRQWQSIWRKVWRQEGEEGFRRLQNYLDDPQYTLTNLPKDKPVIVDAFVQSRKMFNSVRDRIRQVFAEMGIPASEFWGLEEGFYPHRHVGAFMITVNGEPIPNGWLAKTLQEAMKRKEEFKRIFPDAPEPEITYRRFGEGSPWPSAKKFWGHLQARRDEPLPGWVRDPEAVSDYLREASRWMYFAPLRKEAAEIRQALEKAYPGSNITKIWDRYIQQLEGTPEPWIRALEDWAVQHCNQSPGSIRRALGWVRAVQILLKLGYSPVSVIVQSLQTLTNTFPVLGPKWTLRGMRGYLDTFITGKYDNLLSTLGIRDAASKFDDYAILELLRSHAPVRARELPAAAFRAILNVGLIPFRMMDQANRAVAAIGAYERARAAGATHQQAIKKALQVELRTQFGMGQADAMRLMSTATGRTLFQLRTFMFKQLEFMTGLAAKDMPGRFDSRTRELGRFIMATTAASGLVGIPGLYALDRLVKFATGYSMFDKLVTGNPTMRALGRGLPTLVGVDISRNVGFGDWLDWSTITNPFGPAVQDARQAVQALYASFAYPGRVSAQEWERFVNRAWPMLRRLRQAYLSREAKEGELLDVWKRVRVRDLTPSERAMMALGLTPTRVAAEMERYALLSQELSRRTSEERGYVDKIVEELRSPNPDLDKITRLQIEASQKGYPNVYLQALRRLKTVTQERTETIKRRGRRFNLGEDLETEE